ncbi:MAG: hypothetical protein BMS9Abin02_1022 [Anaerolineae bacterium]|nr:MAG: hypothetical protein BMS9Abin02_1022 [Anaerolineae bacterium]
MQSGGLPSRSLLAVFNKSWLRIGLSLLLATVAIFLLARNINIADVQIALSEADYTFIAIALLIFLFTLIVKVWRWYWMFHSGQIRPGIGSLYRAMVVGQFVNFIFPLRMGELARLYSLDLQTGIGKTKILSTVIIEKTLDLVALFLSAALLIPFIVLPEFIVDNGYPLALVGLLVLVSLIFLAYRTEQVTTLVQRASKPFPNGVERKINQVLVAGLNGLSSLRNWRLTLWLGLLSFLIVILAILTPYALFRAFSLPLGFDDALILNLVMTLGMIPPSTPGKILVFEGLVILMLRQFGVVDGNLMLSYAIVFHLVVALPQIVLGTIAFARGGFKLTSVTENDLGQKQSQGS